MKNKNNKKKVIVIGAGVAGLSAGIYSLKKGYTVELFEKNAIAGGECTGWDRKGYHIDNCIHWLMGSKKGTDLNTMYEETHAIDPTNGKGLYHSSVMYTSCLQGQSINLYDDLKRTRNEWLALSPDDKEEIDRLFENCKLGMDVTIPAKIPYEQLGGVSGFLLLAKSIKTFRVFYHYKGMSTQDLMDRFKHPLLKCCISDFCTPESMGYSFPLAYGNFASGDGGIPIGGSRKMALRMLDRFESLGGIFHGSSPVTKIQVSDKKATGIITENGQFHISDYIIAACDAHFTFATLLDPSYMNPVFKDFFARPEAYPIYGMFQAAWAIDSEKDLLEKEIILDARDIRTETWQNERITFKTYGYEPSFAPKGKQIIQALWGMNQKSWEFWETLGKDKKAYEEKKLAFALLIEKKIEAEWPGYKGKLTLLDTWTPCTYERYCNAYHGYNQACVLTKQSMKKPYPSAFIKNLDNVVLAGQWISPPGGIPGACITGKYGAYRVDYLEHKKLRIFKKILFQDIFPTLLIIGCIILF